MDFLFSLFFPSKDPLRFSALRRSWAPSSSSSPEISMVSRPAVHLVGYASAVGFSCLCGCWCLLLLVFYSCISCACCFLFLVLCSSSLLFVLCSFLFLLPSSSSFYVLFLVAIVVIGCMMHVPVYYVQQQSMILVQLASVTEEVPFCGRWRTSSVDGKQW